MTRGLGATCVVKAATNCSYVRSLNFWGATSAPGAYPEMKGGGAERIARAARANFFATTPTQQYSLTEIQRLNRQ